MELLLEWLAVAFVGTAIVIIGVAGIVILSNTPDNNKEE